MRIEPMGAAVLLGDGACQNPKRHYDEDGKA
jgi:hypothetical protein